MYQIKQKIQWDDPMLGGLITKPPNELLFGKQGYFNDKHYYPENHEGNMPHIKNILLG